MAVRRRVDGDWTRERRESSVSFTPASRTHRLILRKKVGPLFAHSSSDSCCCGATGRPIPSRLAGCCSRAGGLLRDSRVDSAGADCAVDSHHTSARASRFGSNLLSDASVGERMWRGRWCVHRAAPVSARVALLVDRPTHVLAGPGDSTRCCFVVVSAAAGADADAEADSDWRCRHISIAPPHPGRRLGDKRQPRADQNKDASDHPRRRRPNRYPQQRSQLTREGSTRWRGLNEERVPVSNFAAGPQGQQEEGRSYKSNSRWRMLLYSHLNFTDVWCTRLVCPEASAVAARDAFGLRPSRRRTRQASTRLPFSGCLVAPVLAPSLATASVAPFFSPPAAGCRAPAPAAPHRRVTLAA